LSRNDSEKIRYERKDYSPEKIKFVFKKVFIEMG
jgi:hypothetical protein